MNQINLLFVCTVNRMRSATAERIYAQDDRFQVDSAGTNATAEVQVEQHQLEWADVVVVMEPVHKRKLKQMFPGIFPRLHVVCLHIPDQYKYMEPALVALVQERVEQLFQQGLLGRH